MGPQLGPLLGLTDVRQRVNATNEPTVPGTFLEAWASNDAKLRDYLGETITSEGDDEASLSSSSRGIIMQQVEQQPTNQRYLFGGMGKCMIEQQDRQIPTGSRDDDTEESPYHGGARAAVNEQRERHNC